MSILRFSSITFFIFLIIITKPPIRLDQEEGYISGNWKLIILAGLGDTLGNIFITLATQSGRFDVAAIISSLFPLTTIFHAWVIHKEKISPFQKIRVKLALAAVVLFSI